MREILDLNIDEESKLKLFTQTLNKFLTLKNKLDNPIQNVNPTENSKEIIQIAPENLLKSTSKKLSSIPRKTQNTSIKTSGEIRASDQSSLRKQRQGKTQARKNIKKYFDEQSSDFSDKNEAYSGWIPFDSPKKIKRLGKK